MKTLYSLGVMTGTSCDGADLALLEISSNGKGEKLVRVASRDFPRPLRSRLREAQKGRLDLRAAARLQRDYSDWVGRFCRAALKKWRTPLARAILAVHGQTVWHEPESGVSVQLLDPAVVGAITTCTVTAAFRQPDLARGGQGAPLVPYYHWLRAMALPEFRAKLPFGVFNVGGISNLTCVTKDRASLRAFDTGPGNALIDMAVERMTNGRAEFDKGGAIARSALAKIDWRAIEKLGRHPYFLKKPPKSTGRELFNEEFLKRIPGRGAVHVANATALTAHTMAKACASYKLNRIYIAGGGALNPTLLSLFKRELQRLTGKTPLVVALPDDFAPPKFLEAMAFARFGYEALLGRPVSVASVTGAREDSIGAGIFPGKGFAELFKGLSHR